MTATAQSTTRYIGYLHLRGGFTSLEFYGSLVDAKHDFAERTAGPLDPGGGEGSFLDLFTADEERIEAAREMDGAGCPFDSGPDRRITLGPRGAVVID